MPRLIRGFILGAMVALLVPASVLAADKGGCPATTAGWEISTPEEAASDFFPHLLPGAFATAAEFADVIDANDNRDGDAWVCIRLSWGFDLNPKSHWYRLGIAGPLNEPVHALHVIDNSAAAQVP